MSASIFTSVLQNRSFLSWKICFFTKICICLQNVIIFAKMNSIFVTNLNNKLQTLRWSFSSIAISRYKHLIFSFTFFKSISTRFQQRVWMHHVCALAGEKGSGWKARENEEFLCSGPVQYPKCQIQEELQGGKGWRQNGGRRKEEVDLSMEDHQGRQAKEPRAWAVPAMVLCFGLVHCETVGTTLKEYHPKLYKT